ncbi:MAG: hypothetical protein OEZ65_10630 [Gemmatimonadota bacterium]|nr:hypothetical protein [Gemmatimonadota bacterium]MDH5760033.1 hypothetical protein [Gemmatimonadota bacterium]
MAGASSPEATEVGRALASIALAWLSQGRQLKVRQREDLRRSIATAAESFGWDTIDLDQLETATKNVSKLTRSGTRSIARQLEDELAVKKAEMSHLKKTAASVRKLSEKADFAEPIEVSYTHTAREGSQRLVTRTETLTLVEPSEAKEAADTIEKRLDGWDKLRVQMVDDLKRRQGQLEELRESVSEFAESSKGLVREVFAVMH